MSDTRTSGPRVTAHQIRDASRLRRPTDDRMVAGVAAGFARQLDIDPTIVRVLFGALTIFGGAGLILYGVAWLTIPEDGQRNSAASDLLRRDPEPVMVVGLILAGVIAGSTMLGTIAFSAPNPWPVMVLVGIAVIVFVIFSRRTDTQPLPPPLPPQGPAGGAPQASPAGGTPQVSPAAGTPQASPSDAPAAEGRGGAEDVVDAGPSDGEPAPYDLVDADRPDAEPAPYGGVSPQDPSEPNGPTAVLPSVPPPPPFPPPPRRPRSRLLPITLCLILVAEGLIWILDQTDTADVAPSVYPGTALGIIAAALIVGAWYGRSRLLILFGVIASVLTMAASFIGPGPFGSHVYTPRTAAAVEDRYELGAGELEIHLENVADIEALDGRSIDIDANVGQVRVYVPSSIDATVHAEVTTGGDIQGIPDVDEKGGGRAEATTIPIDDADPNLEIDVELALGQIDIRYVPCVVGGPTDPTPQRNNDPNGDSNVAAACN
jgi:phage shock protein PspC (stress-responsive transcriptional regulator)